MVRMFKSDGDDGGSRRAFTFRKGVPTINKGASTTPLDWFMSDDLFPDVVSVQIEHRYGVKSNRPACPCHPGSEYITMVARIDYFGSCIVGGVLDPREGASVKYAAVAPLPHVAAIASSGNWDRPAWLPADIDRANEPWWMAYRLEAMLMALLPTVYTLRPSTLGGPHPLMAANAALWDMRSGVATSRADGLSAVDPALWR